MAKKKKDSELEHFQKRMLERFGISISKNTCKEIVREIQLGKHQLLEKQSLRVKKYLVNIDENLIEVIYDKNRKMLVTALPNKNENNPNC